MKYKKPTDERSPFSRHKSDILFAALALIMVAVMTIFLFRYLSLNNQSKTHPEEYGMIQQDLNEVKNRKNELESNIKAINRELQEMNKQLTALSGK